jgi:hypothetical protein
MVGYRGRTGLVVIALTLAACGSSYHRVGSTPIPKADTTPTSAQTDSQQGPAPATGSSPSPSQQGSTSPVSNNGINTPRMTAPAVGPAPTTAQWGSARYSVSGSFTGSQGIFSQTQQVNAQATMYQLVSQGTQPPGIWLGWQTKQSFTGFQLNYGDPAGQTLSSLFFSIPNSNNTATDTSSFWLQPTLDWMSLPVGQTVSGFADQNRYIATMSRPEATQWRFSVAPNPKGPGAWPEIQRGFFTFSLQGPAAPWSAVDINLDASGKYGHLTGTLQFQLLHVGG